ncbi:hypothetical protein PG984_003472 [Apiospora sp. TS-2023a]
MCIVAASQLPPMFRPGIALYLMGTLGNLSFVHIPSGQVPCGCHLLPAASFIKPLVHGLHNLIEITLDDPNSERDDQDEPHDAGNNRSDVLGGESTVRWRASCGGLHGDNRHVGCRGRNSGPFGAFRIRSRYKGLGGLSILARDHRCGRRGGWRYAVVRGATKAAGTALSGH